MDMGNEINLLCCCTHKEMDPSRRRQVRPWLQKGMDWAYLVGLAHDNGMVPLLYQTLKKNFAESVPPTILAGLCQQYLWNLRSSLFLNAELLRLLQQFQEQGIPVVPLKGPALATFLYGHPGMRTFSDLDLLFQKKDVPKAKALLVSLGFGFSLPFAEAQREIHLRSEKEACMVREKGRLSVEVLWGTPGDFPINLDFAPFWERLRRETFEGREIFTFCPEDWVLILSLHHASHCWKRLIWLLDLHTWIQAHPNLDWEELMKRAKILGCRRVLFTSLALVQRVLQDPLPERIAEKVREDQTAQSLARQASQWLFHDGRVPPVKYNQTRFFLKVPDRWRDRIAFCIRQAMIPTMVDWLAWPLPRRLFPLYYFYHPLRMAGNVGRRLLKSFTPGEPRRIANEPPGGNL